MQRKLLLLMLSLLIASCSKVHTIEKNTATPTQHSPLQIDAAIHLLLKQEMQAIQQGMMSLIPAIASGNWKKVATIGQHLEGSYLLKQKLSPKQRHALHLSLPAEFIKQDHAFHSTAGLLAKAAQMSHAENVSFYLAKLTSACVRCHTEFASEKFPLLKK